MKNTSLLENSTVVVTGASGFIGSHLVDYLVEHGCIVHAVIRETSDRRWLNKSGQVKIHIANLEEKPLLSCIEKADYLFHCSGVTKAKTRKKYISGNSYSCENLYERCAIAGHNLKKIIHLSSLAATGPSDQCTPVDEKNLCKPITYYGESKLLGEEVAVKYFSSLPIVILRPPVVYGPRELSFFVYLKTLSKGWNIKVGRLSRELSLIYVSDLVRAMIQAALYHPQSQRIYFVTDGESYTWDNVAESAMKNFDVNIKNVALPEMLLSFLSNAIEALAWFSSEPALFDRQRMIDLRQISWVASSRAFFEAHTFEPKYNLEKGLKETIEWYKNNKWLQ